MTTEKYLMQALRFERMIANKMTEMARCKDLITSISVSNDGERVQTSGSKDKIGSFASKIVDLEKEVQWLAISRDKIIEQIESMSDPDSYQVLYSKYIDNQNLYEIRTIIHCSKTQVYRIHDRALAEFEQKFGDLYLEIN